VLVGEARDGTHVVRVSPVAGRELLARQVRPREWGQGTMISPPPQYHRGLDVLIATDRANDL
jgi:hypothetical protein